MRACNSLKVAGSLSTLAQPNSPRTPRKLAM
jgi:hypothetical protein